MGMFIYLVTNLIDGKMYVGKTEKPVARRWRDHKYKAYHRGVQWNYYLYRAIRKHGPENFSIQCLAEARSSEELSQLEKLWIIILSTTAPNGYNLTSGGDGVSGTPEIREKQRRKALNRPTSARQKEVTSQMWKGKAKPAAQRAKMAKHWDKERRDQQAKIAIATNKVENAKLKDYECPTCGVKFEQVTKGVYGGHRRYCLHYRNP
jgi:group I intron endonuclease